MHEELFNKISEYHALKLFIMHIRKYDIISGLGSMECMHCNPEINVFY